MANVLSRRYASYTQEVNVRSGTETLFFAIYMIPLTGGLTRAMLRWGDTPADLDMFVVPIGVTDSARNPVKWSSREPGGAIVSPPSTSSSNQVCLRANLCSSSFCRFSC